MEVEEIQKLSQAESLKGNRKCEERRVLFSYSTGHLQEKDRIRFFYALKGRNGKKGMMDLVGAERFGRSVLIVPQKRSVDFKQFFKEWGCCFKELPVVLDKTR